MRNVLICLCFVFGATASSAEVGVITHFLPGERYFKKNVSEFDVDLLVAELKEMGVSYYIFTLGQNSGFYNSKNDIFESMCNVESADRYLIKELAEKLDKENIRFYLYLPFRGPQKNKPILKCLEDGSEQSPVSKKFVNNWARIIKFWSNELGTNLAGWWFDGVYNVSGIDFYDWKVFCESALYKNNKRLIALNAGEGIGKYQKKTAYCQNWNAGELNDVVANLPYLKINKSFKKNHIMTPLGESWGREGIKYSQADFSDILVELNKNWMITLDIKMDRPGVLNAAQGDFVKKQIRNFNGL